jgi:hypothetical protein
LVALWLAERWEEIDRRRWVAMGALAAGVTAFAQLAFSIYYHGGRVFGLQVPGFHAELHRLTRDARAKAGTGDRFGEYQMSRREKSLGTGELKIQETSHPSILAYLDSDVINAERFEDFLRAPGRVWILTRWNRVTLDDFAAARRAGRSLEQVPTPTTQKYYRLYLLR